jgi:DNA-binding GntR family transcriptional regulator
MDNSFSLRIRPPDAPLSEKMVAAVRDAISSGALEPGRRLTEREMMVLTGVSRTSAREALRELRTLGLIEKGPQGGLRIAVLDRAAIQHIYEVRAAVESTATELFALRATKAEVAEYLRLVQIDQDTRDLDGPVDATRTLALDRLILRGARNPILTEILEPLHARIQSLRRLSLSRPGRYAASCAETDAIADAIRARDPERANAASHRHLEAAMRSALEVVESSTTPAEASA